MYISEFDGQSALTYFKGKFFLFARSNPKKAGYRSVQACSGKHIEDFGPFQLCHFGGLNYGYDMYFLHPYSLPHAIFSLIALVPAESQKNDEWPSGIYITASTDGRTFIKPYLVHRCEDFERRTYDLPVNGKFLLDHPEEGHMSFTIHANVSCRLPKNSKLKEDIHCVSCEMPLHFCNLWRGVKSDDLYHRYETTDVNSQRSVRPRLI